MTQITFEGADVLQTGPVTETSQAPGRMSGVNRRATAFLAIPNLPMFAGVGVSIAGLVLLVIAWGRVAGLTNVALQIPYVISAGFTGLALVCIGLTVVNVSVKRTDSLERTRQLSELRSLLSELRTTIEEEGR